MTTSFHHIAISVTDIERSIRFYTELFEMEQLTPVFPIGGPLYDRVLGLKGVAGKMCVMAKAGFHLELFHFSEPAPASKDPDYSVADRGLTHFGVVVDDIESTYQRMLGAGVRFHSPVMQFPGGTRATYGRDPDGNVFELVERPSTV